VGKSPGNHKQECKSAGHVASYPVLRHRSCRRLQYENGEKRYSCCKRW